MSYNELDYHAIVSTYADRVPILDWNEDDYELRGSLRFDRPWSFTEPMQLSIGMCSSRKPKLVDYFSSTESVVSQKVADVLAPINIHGMQLMPAQLTLKTGEVHALTWIHTWHFFFCVDRRRSRIVWSEFTPNMTHHIERIAFDVDILASVPLEQRLVFKLGESSDITFYHRSVMEAILAVKPVGVRFVPYEQWTEGALFDTPSPEP